MMPWASVERLGLKLVKFTGPRSSIDRPAARAYKRSDRIPLG